MISIMEQKAAYANNNSINFSTINYQDGDGKDYLINEAKLLLQDEFHIEDMDEDIFSDLKDPTE